MRINWFSPLPPARTDIANFTARLLPALTAQAEVALWAPQDEWELPNLPRLTARSALAQHLPWTEINFREFSVFQVGNDLRFHGPLVQILEQHGGLVVLHDTNLHEMQRMRHVVARDRPEAYLSRLAREGGEPALALGRAVLRGEVSVEEAAVRYPLTGSVLAGAHGAIVHNPEELPRVAALTHAPCRYLPLPYAESLPPVPERQRAPSEPLRLVLFGFLHGENRRLRPILDAWARFPQRDRLRLSIFGEYDQPAVEALLQERGLRHQAELRGFLSEAEIGAELQAADLALNLRFPSRGEASGSLLRIWSHALPCLVSRAGYYAKLPETLVSQVDPEQEEADLHCYWAAFLRDRGPFREQGLAGRLHLERHHQPEAYVRALLDFLPEVAAYRRDAYLERWLPRMAQEFLAPLPHWAAQQHWKHRIATELSSWSGPEKG